MYGRLKYRPLCSDQQSESDKTFTWIPLCVHREQNVVSAQPRAASQPCASAVSGAKSRVGDVGIGPATIPPPRPSPSVAVSHIPIDDVWLSSTLPWEAAIATNSFCAAAIRRAVGLLSWSATPRVGEVPRAAFAAL